MSEKLKIVYLPLQKLSPYAHNARTHSPEQVAQLVESIKQFGWTNPVLIDEKGEIIAGHGRVMAAEVLKMDSVPVIVLSGLKEDQKKAYRLADNRLPLNAGWDEELLRMELSELINADFDISLTGFTFRSSLTDGCVKICHCFPIFFQSVQINIQNISDLLCGHPARSQRLDFRIRNHLSPPLVCRVSSSCIFR